MPIFSKLQRPRPAGSPGTAARLCTHGPDALLVDIASGEVIQVVDDVFR